MNVILGIDALRFPLTGIGRYTYELASALGRDQRVNSLCFLQGLQLRAALPEPHVLASTSMLARLWPWLRKSRLAALLYRRGLPWAQGRILRGREEALFHGPNSSLPSFGGTSVVTIHDLSAYFWSDCHPPERVPFLRRAIEQAVRRAALILTVSEFTRHEVAHFFQWPLERVWAAPLAGAAEFHPRAPDTLAPCLARYGLVPGGYSLFVGTIEPRKNIDRLLDAYSLLPPGLRRRWPLILAGDRGWRSAGIHARMAAAREEGWGRYLGFVPAADLPVLYAGARLFVYPSLYEGFGLPVIEAMASGVPVVCSNAASLPEVAGAAAALCDPDDVEGLSRLLRRGLEDGPWRAEARDRGLAQAGQFSWRRCAATTISAYQSALTRS